MLPSHILLAVVPSQITIGRHLSEAHFVPSCVRRLLLGLGGLLLSSVRDRGRDFEFGWQVVRIDKLKDDVLELTQTPPNLKRGVIAQGWELRDEILNLIMHQTGFGTIQIHCVQLR